VPFVPDTFFAAAGTCGASGLGWGTAGPAGL